MEVSFVTADASPHESRGAFTVATLAKGLKALGHKVTMILPGTAAVDALPISLARRLSKLVVELDGESIALDVRNGRTQHGLDLVVLGSPDEMGDDAGAFETGDAAAARRLSLFCEAAARTVAESGAEAVHGLGIAGALALAYLPGEDSTAVRVLSVDDPSRVGRFDLELERLFGLGPDAHEATHVALLKAGILAADAVLVPSSSVGRAIAASTDHPLLAATLAKRAGSVHVVAPGLDGSVWNPLTDPHLASRFDPVDRSGKARCASALCKELGLPIRAGAPVLAVELANEAALEGLLESIRAALRLDASVVVRALTGASALDALAERWPDRLVVRTTRDEPFLHRIFGAADLALVVSEDAASSAAVLTGLRYGAIPLVSRAHPLADRLVDCEPSLRTGTAFLADGLDQESLLATTRRALAAYHLGVPFELVRQRAMRVDVSLDRMARLTERLYRTARTDAEIRAAVS